MKNVLIFLGGASIGALSSFFVTRKMITKKLNEKHDEEMKRLEYYYTSEKNPACDISEEVCEVETEVPEVKPIKAPEEYTGNAKEGSLIRESASRINKIRQRTDYTSFTHPTEYDDDDLSAIQMTKDREMAGDPYYIKAVDYMSEPYMEGMTLTYYQDNDVLTIADDVNEEVLEDFDEVEAMLGTVLTDYGFKQDDTPVIYIRNPKRNMDYEVIKVFDRYTGS